MWMLATITEIQQDSGWKQVLARGFKPKPPPKNRERKVKVSLSLAPPSRLKDRTADGIGDKAVSRVMTRRPPRTPSEEQTA
jgi:hypothetical protein